MSNSTNFLASSRPSKDLVKQNLHVAAEHSGKEDLSTFFSPHTQVTDSELGGLADDTDELEEVTGGLDTRSAISGGVVRLEGGATA